MTYLVNFSRKINSIIVAATYAAVGNVLKALMVVCVRCTASLMARNYVTSVAPNLIVFMNIVGAFVLLENGGFVVLFQARWVLYSCVVLSARYFDVSVYC